MISEQYIEKLIRDYAKTPEGKKKIRDTYGIVYDEKFDCDVARAYGERMADILFDYVNSVIKSITRDDIVVGDPTVDENGVTTLPVYFKDSALRRESLDPMQYPNGITNIVLLFAKGYHANGAVYGPWLRAGGKPTWSRQHREPNDFLNAAVMSFNNSYKGIAIAKLEPKYENK